MLTQGGAQRVMMKFHFLRLAFQRVRTHLTSDPIAAIDVLNSNVFSRVSKVSTHKERAMSDDWVTYPRARLYHTILSRHTSYLSQAPQAVPL